MVHANALNINDFLVKNNEKSSKNTAFAVGFHGQISRHSWLSSGSTDTLPVSKSCMRPVFNTRNLARATVKSFRAGRG